MNPRSLLLCVVTLAVSVAWAGEAKLELKPIFNGKDLTGFKDAIGNKFWRVENGILICQNDEKLTGNYLETEKEYRDFVMEFDVRWKTETPRGVDTGIDLRKPRIQLQLGVSGSLKVDMSGSFYVGKPGYPEAGQAKEAKKLMKPEGEWNTFRLQAKGDTFTCWINGTKASEYTDPKFPGAASIGLQLHGNVKMKAEYRNIRLAELK
ncbi:MAG: DUF1080 domain-containing protein [Opitutaceae bacterium]|nr:DUF1080 domain-containing protein [Opitutaceae bacterium]